MNHEHTPRDTSDSEHTDLVKPEERTIYLNKRPISIPNMQYAISERALQGYNVVTVKPSDNYAQSYRLMVGGKPEEGDLDGGAPIPLPLVRKFGSTLRIDNTSTQKNTRFDAGIYTFTEKPTVPIGQPIGPYHSAGARTLAQPQTLMLRCTGTQSALAIVFVGNQAPQCYALNTEKLPPQWQGLPNFTPVPQEVHRLPAENYYGQYMFIVNVSSTPDAVIETHLT